MKNTISFFILFLLTCFAQAPSFAQTSSFVQVASLAQAPLVETSMKPNLWPDRSPRTLAAGRKALPLLGVKKMGAANNMEWQMQPIFFFVAPNLGLKKQWKTTSGGLRFSSLHRIHYPSIYLNLLAREGAGGVLPKDSEIPPMLSFKNELLLGIYKQGNSITLRAGITAAFKLGDGEKNFPDIDVPFLYNRTLALNHTPNIYMGLNFNRDILPTLNMEIDVAAFKVDPKSSDFVYESQLIFFWKKSNKFGLKAGVAAAHGRYPYGAEFQLLPVFDIVFGI